MKKRQKMLAALVLGSIMQMSVTYAADYNDQSNVIGETINFDKMEVGKYSPENITIGDGNTKSIIIGSENASDYVLQLNDPILANQQGSHNLTLTADDIKILGGKGIEMGGQRESDATMLTIKGKNFTVDSKEEEGGMSAEGYGSVKIGSNDNWLEEVTIKGGQGFSVGFVGSGSADDRNVEIYSDKVVFDTTEAKDSKGTAFSNGSSNVLLNAGDITIKSKKTNGSNTNGAVYVYNSTTNFNADNITIITKNTNELENKYLYAVNAKENYDLNFNANKKLDIQGNILLEGSGIARFTGGDIVIAGNHTDYGDKDDGNKGSAVNIIGKSTLYLGTEENNANSVTINSDGKFGILVGRDNNSNDSSYAAKLKSDVVGLFSVTAQAENGCGISVQDKGNVDIKTGTMLIEAKNIGLHFHNGSMQASSTGDIVINSDGVGISAQGSSNALNLDSGSNIVINSKKGAIYNYLQFETDLTAKNIVINSTDELTDNDTEKAVIYGNGYKSSMPTINLNAENGIVSINAANRGVWASAKGSTVNIEGALQIYTTKNTDNKDFALAAGGKGNNNSKLPDGSGKVNITLKGSQDSFIGNDIIASDNGVITITRDTSYTGKLVVEGDILAGGNKVDTTGKIDIDFGKDGIFTGTANNKGFKTLLDKFVTKAGVIDLTFGEGSTWNMTGDSFMNNLVANKSVIDMTADNKAFSSLNTNSFTGDGNTIKMDIDASTNVYNSDRIYVDGTHDGTHYITLENVGVNTDGAEGTVLVSVKDEQGEFKANDSEGTLYWNKYDLAKYEKANGDTVTNGYTTDWYLDKVEVVDPGDKPTTSVDTVLSVNSLNYHTWRTENDKLLQRMGELRHNGEAEKGAWFRVKGSKIGYDGEFENKYTTYELGYDEITKRTEDMVRYQGAALSYVDGKSSYSSGSGDNHGKSIGFYTTEQYSKGHYLDLVFNISNMDNDFKVFDTKGNKITGEYDNTGVSISAEYGRKNDLEHGWYIEPQAQLTLGYMGGAKYETNNGIFVDQSGIKSALGRIGFNIGKQIGEKGIVYAKANLLHEFGGGYDVAMEAADGSMTVSNTYNDTWFEYGVGIALATGDNSHIYFDVERSTGSDFYKDWQWNAGVRWNF